MKPFALDAFSILRAEEEEWLAECYVAPFDFDRLANDRSLIIFGGIGAGKTALYEMMKRRNVTDGFPQRLLIDWRPSAPVATTSGTTASVKEQLDHILELCARELAAYVVQFPERYRAAPDWAQHRVVWFLHKLLGNVPALRLGPLLATPAPGADLLQSLLSTAPEPVLHDHAPPETILDELCLALEPLGLHGVWIMADDIERLAQIDEKVLLENLLALLATLPLFERSTFAFKLFVPSRLEGEVSKASGLMRRRIDAVHLRWSTAELRAIVEKRLRVVSDAHLCRLEDLCNARKLPEWLESAGGESPRHWLDQVQPLVKYYLMNRPDRPIDEKQWRKLIFDHPPQLYLFPSRRMVVVGGREITLDEVPAKAIDMLAYLYEHGNQIVPKEDLYFRAYLGRDHAPRIPADPGYEARDEYEGVVDTNIWRLRKVIEPEPKMPVLIETKRGLGLRLRVRW
jgi:DNA-binding response OmpR family regulator